MSGRRGQPPAKQRERPWQFYRPAWMKTQQEPRERPGGREYLNW